MMPIARVGDVHVCPLHGPNVIASGGIASVDGMPIARMGDACACGGVIVDGSVVGADDGRPIAYLGCRTSCGGVIASGSPAHRIEP